MKIELDLTLEEADALAQKFRTRGYAIAAGIDEVRPEDTAYQKLFAAISRARAEIQP